MSNIYKIAVDVMGGDRGPEVVIKGALDALRKLSFKDYHIILVGIKSEIEAILNSRKFKSLYRRFSSRISIVHAPEVVSMGEKPEEAFVVKPNSSIALGIGLVQRGEADAFVSAGNTGAVAFHSAKQLGCLDSLIRPALSAIIPTQIGSCVVIDIGANLDSKARHLRQFAIMGLAYALKVLGIKNPRIGLLNVGTEKGKGSKTVREAYDLLERMPGFIGNVEGKDIPRGKADVVVCDGFVGNAMLKFIEGVYSAAKRILTNMPKWRRRAAYSAVAAITIIPPILLFFLNSSRRSLLCMVYIPLWLLAYFLFLPGLRYIRHRFDYAEHGGAPLLGVEGVVIVCHGRSRSNAIMNAIRQAILSIIQDVSSEIREQLKIYNSTLHQ